MPRTPRTEEQNERTRLKRLVERAAHLAIRGRALSEGLRRHDRQAAVYLMNLARQSARLLQQIPSNQVPTLRLPVGPGEARGSQQHVLRHTRVEQNGTVIMQFLVLSSDGRMRICTADLAQPATRLWRDYDPGVSPDDFDFDDTADALATLLDTLEQVLAASEARLAERIANLEQRRRERSPNKSGPRPALATSTAAVPSAPGASVESAAADTAGAPPTESAEPSIDERHDHPPTADESDDIMPAIAATVGPVADLPESLPFIDDAESTPPALEGAASPHKQTSGWPDAEDAGITRRRGFRLSRLGRTI